MRLPCAVNMGAIALMDFISSLRWSFHFSILRSHYKFIFHVMEIWNGFLTSLNHSGKMLRENGKPAVT